uniref:Uncharacterized protein n=1 Tax=Arundo donax TaxID=35708 RepID=A0A0A9BU90_ARUDO
MDCHFRYKIQGYNLRVHYDLYCLCLYYHLGIR